MWQEIRSLTVFPLRCSSHLCYCRLFTESVNVIKVMVLVDIIPRTLFFSLTWTTKTDEVVQRRFREWKYPALPMDVSKTSPTPLPVREQLHIDPESLRVSPPRFSSLFFVLWLKRLCPMQNSPYNAPLGYSKDTPFCIINDSHVEYVNIKSGDGSSLVPMLHSCDASSAAFSLPVQLIWSIACITCGRRSLNSLH